MQERVRRNMRVQAQLAKDTITQPKPSENLPLTPLPQTRTEANEFRPDSTRNIFHQLWNGVVNQLQGTNDFNLLKGRFGAYGSGFLGGLMYTLGMPQQVAIGFGADQVNSYDESVKNLSQGRGNIVTDLFNLTNVVNPLGVLNDGIRKLDRLFNPNPNRQPMSLFHDDNKNDNNVWNAIVGNFANGDIPSFSDPRDKPGAIVGLGLPVAERVALGGDPKKGGAWYKDPAFYAGLGIDIVLDPLDPIMDWVKPLQKLGIRKPPKKATTQVAQEIQKGIPPKAPVAGLLPPANRLPMGKTITTPYTGPTPGRGVIKVWPTNPVLKQGKLPKLLTGGIGEVPPATVFVPPNTGPTAGKVIVVPDRKPLLMPVQTAGELAPSPGTHLPKSAIPGFEFTQVGKSPKLLTPSIDKILPPSYNVGDFVKLTPTGRAKRNLILPARLPGDESITLIPQKLEQTGDVILRQGTSVLEPVEAVQPRKLLPSSSANTVDKRVFSGEYTLDEFVGLLETPTPGMKIDPSEFKKTRRTLAQLSELGKYIPGPNGKPLVKATTKRGFKTWEHLQARIASIPDPVYRRLFAMEGPPIDVEALKKGDFTIVDKKLGTAVAEVPNASKRSSTTGAGELKVYTDPSVIDKPLSDIELKRQILAKRRGVTPPSIEKIEVKGKPVSQISEAKRARDAALRDIRNAATEDDLDKALSVFDDAQSYIDSPVIRNSADVAEVHKNLPIKLQTDDPKVLQRLVDLNTQFRNAADEVRHLSLRLREAKEIAERTINDVMTKRPDIGRRNYTGAVTKPPMQAELPLTVKSTGKGKQVRVYHGTRVQDLDFQIADPIMGGGKAELGPAHYFTTDSELAKT